MATTSRIKLRRPERGWAASERKAYSGHRAEAQRLRQQSDALFMEAATAEANVLEQIAEGIKRRRPEFKDKKFKAEHNAKGAVVALTFLGLPDQDPAAPLAPVPLPAAVASGAALGSSPAAPVAPASEPSLASPAKELPQESKA